MTSKNVSLFQTPTIERIKKLGADKSNESFEELLKFFYDENLDIDLRRELASSIGRQNDNDKILLFLQKEAFNNHYMEVVYQFFRTALYKSKVDSRFANLRDRMLKHYNNEVMQKMFEFYNFRQSKKKNHNKEAQIKKPTLLIGDNRETLKRINDKQIQLIFTSPPYYNARLYSDYTSYDNYLCAMKESFMQCNRILEDGRFIVVNISPVITKRVGREFESIRYPIHFDFHKLLCLLDKNINKDVVCDTSFEAKGIL